MADAYLHSWICTQRSFCYIYLQIPNLHVYSSIPIVRSSTNKLYTAWWFQVILFSVASTLPWNDGNFVSLTHWRVLTSTFWDDNSFYTNHNQWNWLQFALLTTAFKDTFWDDTSSYARVSPTAVVATRNVCRKRPHRPVVSPRWLWQVYHATDRNQWSWDARVGYPVIACLAVGLEGLYACLISLYRSNWELPGVVKDVLHSDASKCMLICGQ